MRRRLVLVENEFYDSALHAHRARAMAGALARAGVDVTAVCSYQREPRSLPEFEHVVWLPPCGPGALRNARFLAMAWAAVGREIRGPRPPDWVVLCKRSGPCAFPHDLLWRLGRRGTGRPACLRGRPAVLDLRTLEYGSGLQERRVRDAALHTATRLALVYSGVAHAGATAITPSLAAEVARLSGRAHVGVWGSGWDPEGPVAEPPAELRRALQGRVVAVYHGTLSAERGLVTMFEAVDLARRELPGLLLVVCGSGTQWGELAAARRRLGLGEHVLLHPALPHDMVVGLLRRAHLAVVPYPDSDYWLYNQPLKIVESLGAGLPVVTPRNRGFSAAFPGCPAIVQARDGSAGALAEVLLEVAGDDERRERLSRAARDHAAALTWDAQAGRLLDYLERLGKRGAG